MLKRTFSFLMVTIFLISTVTVAFNIQTAKAASETIIDTEVGESRFTTYPQRQSPYYWVHVQNHDTFYTRAYGSNFWYTLCGEDGSGEPLYYGLWQASLPSSGVYEVFVWIPNPNAFTYDGRVYTPTQSAIYQIYHKNGMATRTVNQRSRTGSWYSIGTYTFDTTASVILNDRTGETYLSTMIAFDAIKFVSFTGNQPFTLSNGYVTPSSGNAATVFEYYVTYSDPEGDIPTTKYVYIDIGGSPFTMTNISGDYVSGATFKYSGTLPAGSHSYYFSFKDSVHAHTVKLPVTGTYPGPSVPAGDFSIMTSKTSLSIQRGGSGSSTITLTSIDGFSQPLQLLSYCPLSGVTATFSPQQVTPPVGGSITSTLTVSVAATATVGTCTLLLSANNGTLTRLTTISLEITIGTPTTKLLVQPDSIIDEALTPGNTFKITIRVADVYNLYGYEFKLKFEYAKLQLMSAVRPAGHFLEPTIDPWNYFAPVWKINETRDATYQTAHFGYTLLAPETGRTGSGALVEMTFRVQSLGASAITIKDSKLSDTAAASVPHMIFNGYFRNTLFLALPVIVSPLLITPVKEIYNVGDTLEAEFTIKNIGGNPITLDVLTLGGRLNGWIQADGYPDFTHRQVTLQPGVPYPYSGSLTLTQTGNYRFFVAYHVADPNPEEKKLLDENNWNTCVELGEGLTQTSRVKNIIVFEEGTIPDDVVSMRKTISRSIRLNPQIPPYLLGVEGWKESVATIWADWTSWATQTDLRGKYDELYYAGINYYGLRSKALSDANHALDRGDIEYAKKCVARSRTYDKLACMSFVAAAEVFDGNMEAGQVLATGIREGCETAVKYGVKVLFPSAGIVADGIYLIMDFGLNTWIEGVDKATVDMAVDLAFTLVFQSVKFPSIGGNTLETYVNTVSQNMPFTELLRNEEFMKEFGFELFNVIAQRVLVQFGITLTEYKLKEMVQAIVQRLASMGDSEQSGTKCPVELRVQDSEGRLTGLINGRVKQEIPLSLCYNGTVQIFFPSDSYSYELIGKDIGTYGLTITLTKDGNTTTFDATDIPISINAKHVYNIDWTALSRGEEGVTVQVDSNGDGVVERTLISDNELTREEFQGTIEGDITQDGVVDIFDLVTAVIAYGSTPSTQSWDARCDLNGDNVIDVFDLSIVAINFGKEQTPP